MGTCLPGISLRSLGTLGAGVPGISFGALGAGVPGISFGALGACLPLLALGTSRAFWALDGTVIHPEVVHPVPYIDRVGRGGTNAVSVSGPRRWHRLL